MPSHLAFFAGGPGRPQTSFSSSSGHDSQGTDMLDLVMVGTTLQRLLQVGLAP
jgi:hypothetical protein